MFLFKCSCQFKFMLSFYHYVIHRVSIFSGFDTGKVLNVYVVLHSSELVQGTHLLGLWDDRPVEPVGPRGSNLLQPDTILFQVGKIT